VFPISVLETLALDLSVIMGLSYSREFATNAVNRVDSFDVYQGIKIFID